MNMKNATSQWSVSSQSIIIRMYIFLSLMIVLTLISINTSKAAISGDNPYANSLNGNWLFKTDLYNVGEMQKWYLPEQDIAAWEPMSVPGNWDLKDEYADYVGKGWYRRTFDVPVDWKDKNTRLVFEAVYNDAKVWINGKEVGAHHVGFLPFWFDINDYLEYGGTNTIVVVADNTFKRGAIWNWGGIRRPVWLEVTPKIRLEYQHITAVPDLKKGTSNVNIEFEIRNLNGVNERVDYRLEIFRDDEQISDMIAKNSGQTIEIQPGDSLIKNIVIHLPRSKTFLWDFDHPHLYTARLEILQNSQVVHQLVDRFGIRKVEVDGEQFKINGEVVRTVGFNLVPEDRTTGSTLPLWRIKQDVDMMKSLGANMARLSHLPLPEAFLDYLDEKGIMVFEEVSLWGKDKMVDPNHPLPKYWLEKMVYVQYNHPSIIGWSVGNEIGSLSRNPKVMDYVKGAIEQAKRLDPNRLTVYISNTAASQKTDPVIYSDLIMLNSYGGWGERAKKAHELHPGKPIFMSEYGSSLNVEDLNEATIDAKKMLDEFRDKPYMTGVSLWTFNDYRSMYKGSASWTTPPSQNRTWGIVNVFRQKKRAYYTFRKEYAPVKAMDVSVEDGMAKITIVPRTELDIPSYILKDYKLVWTTFDEQQHVIFGGMEQLPIVYPGDAVLKRSLNIRGSGKKVEDVRIDLLSPENYSVLDTTLYFSIPKSPTIFTVHTASNEARVVFDPVPFAEAYKVLYGKETLNNTTDLTIDHFIDISKLEHSEKYRFAVVAVNNAGESASSKVAEATMDEDELPPVVWTTVPYDNNFFIGYSVDRLDYMYEIEYGTAPGQYDHQIGLRNFGVCQVPGLQKGGTYYYRMRNRKQWGFASEWAREIKVDLKPAMDTLSVPLLGVIKNKAGYLLCFDPVKKCIGYVVSYKEKSEAHWHRELINQVEIHYAILKGLNIKRDYDFKLEAILNDREYMNCDLQGKVH